MSVTIVLQNDTTYTLLCENDYDMSCWSDGLNILLHKEVRLKKIIFINISIADRFFCLS